MPHNRIRSQPSRDRSFAPQTIRLSTRMSKVESKKVVPKIETAPAAAAAAKQPYSPPKVEELGSVLELTRGSGDGRADTPLGTFSVRGT